MIVVLDTNVWVSAIHFGKLNGSPRRALDQATLVDTLATCDEIEAEIFRILTEKFTRDRYETRERMELLLALSIRVKLDDSVRICRDPKDDMILECALRAKADLIVAGDKDLLVLGTFEGTRIVTPAEYLNLTK